MSKMTRILAYAAAVARLPGVRRAAFLAGPRAQGFYLAIVLGLALTTGAPGDLSIDLTDVAEFCKSYGGQHEQILP